MTEFGNGGGAPPMVLQPDLGNISESIHTLLSERECNFFDRALVEYQKRRRLEQFVELLGKVLNTNQKRQLLLPIRDTYIKESDVSRFNKLSVQHGLATTLDRKKKRTKKKSEEGSCGERGGVEMVKVKRDADGEWGFTIRGGSDTGSEVFVAWIEPGSNADKSGLQVGDQILKADETDFDKITHYDAIKIIKDSKKLHLWVLPHAQVRSREGHKAFNWVSTDGKPASPPLDAPRIIGEDGKKMKSPSERTVRIVIEEGRELGISIRGGSEYGLGVYISKIEDGSVGKEQGLKVGDQILEVNEKSFLNIRHSDAAKMLSSNHMMVMKLKDIGKLPAAKKPPPGHMRSATLPPKHLQPENPNLMKLTTYPGPGQQTQGKKLSPPRGVIESLATQLLEQHELLLFKHIISDYEHQFMSVEDFSRALLDLLKQPEKLSLLGEVRAVIRPADLAKYTELTVRKEMEAKKARKALEGGQVFSKTLPNKKMARSKGYAVKDDENDTAPLTGYMSEDLDEPDVEDSLRAARNTGSLDDIPQRLSPHSNDLLQILQPSLKMSTSTPEQSEGLLTNTLKERRKRLQQEDSEIMNDDLFSSQTELHDQVTQKGVPTLIEVKKRSDAFAVSAAEIEARLRKEFEEKERTRIEELKTKLEEEQRKKEDAVMAEKSALERRIREVEERTKREAEEKVRRHLEEQQQELLRKAQQEQEEKLLAERKAAEARIKEAEERNKRELEQMIRKEAEERMKAEFDARMRQEAAKLKETAATQSAQAARAAEEKIRMELEAKLQKEYELKLEQEIKKRAREDEADRKRRQEEFLTSKEAEAARLEAEEEARMVLEEKIRQEAEAKIRAEYEARLQRETEEKVRLAEEVKAHKAAGSRLQKEQSAEEVRRNQRETEDKVRLAVEVKAHAAMGSRFQSAEEVKRKGPEVAKKPDRKLKAEGHSVSEQDDLLMAQARPGLGSKLREQAESEAQNKEEERKKKEELQRKRDENLKKREQMDKALASFQQKSLPGKQNRSTHRAAEQEAAARHKAEEEQLAKEQAEREKAEREEKERVAAQEKAERERMEQKERERAEQEERERAEQEERERAEQEERERAEQEERERAELEERKRAEQEKRERAEQEERARALLEQERAARERAELEKTEQLERARKEKEAKELRVRQEAERAEQERKQKQLQKKQEEEERRKQAVEERKRAQEERRITFNVKHEPVNFGSDMPPAKTKQELVDEERAEAEEKLRRKLEKVMMAGHEDNIGAARTSTPMQHSLPESSTKADQEQLDAELEAPGFSFAGYDNLNGKLVTIRITKISKKLGIAIDGGYNTKQKAVIIRELTPDGCAAQTGTGLKVGQQILQVNGNSLYGMKHRDVVMNIKDAFEGPLKKTIEFVVLDKEEV